MSEFNFGESIRLINTFKDIDGNLYNPDTISLVINDAEGTLKETVTLADGFIVMDSIGVYYHDYLIPAGSTAQGYWLGIWTATVGASVDVSEEQFYARPAGEKLYVSTSEVQDALMGSVDITMSDDTLRNLIRYAAGEVDRITGRSFYNKTSRTEWFDTLTSNPNTQLDKLFLTYLPLQEIVSLEHWDTNNELVKAYTSDEYYTDINGILTLLRGTFVHGKHSLKVIYYSGYTSVPIHISHLTNIIAQIKLLRHYMQAQDSKMTSFSVPEIGEVSLGEVYTVSNILVQQLEREKKELIKTIGNLRNDTFII